MAAPDPKFHFIECFSACVDTDFGTSGFHDEPDA